MKHVFYTLAGGSNSSSSLDMSAKAVVCNPGLQLTTLIINNSKLKSMCVEEVCVKVEQERQLGSSRVRRHSRK